MVSQKETVQNVFMINRTLCPALQLPSSSKWGQQSANTINHNTLSLAEIQKLEEERERQAREEVRTAATAIFKTFFEL